MNQIRKHGRILQIKTMSLWRHTWKKLTTGLIDIDLRFRMEPMLAKRIYMDPDGLFRGSFNILVEGDWTDGDGGTCDDSCGQNKIVTNSIFRCYAGPNVIDTHHETGLVQGQNTVVFNFGIEEETIVDWDGNDYNPEVRITMKVNGELQSTGFLVLAKVATRKVRNVYG